MNILKALEGLSGVQDGNNMTQPEQPAAPTKPSSAESNPPAPNVMASVIERHERISNRVRANTKRN